MASASAAASCARGARCRSAGRGRRGGGSGSARGRASARGAACRGAGRRRRVSGALEAPGEEEPVELDVVRAQDGAVEQLDELTGDGAKAGRAPKRAPGQPVHIFPPERPPGSLEQRVPPVDHRAVAEHPHDADLEEAVAIRAQAAGLDVDDGEAGGGQRPATFPDRWPPAAPRPWPEECWHAGRGP